MSHSFHVVDSNGFCRKMSRSGEYCPGASDAPPASYKAPQGMHVSISVASPTEGERIFKALAENGKVSMPFQKAFWSPGFGMLVDRFGIPWMVNTEQTS